MSHRSDFLKTRKPAAAQRHRPDGYPETVPCKACKGSGKVAKDDDLTARMVRRV